MNRAGSSRDVDKRMDFKVWGKIDSKNIKISEKHFVADSPISSLSFLNGVGI